MFKKRIKTPKVSGKDRRVGNFIYHREEDYIKVFDINGVISHRYSILTSKGMSLLSIYEDGNETALQNYAVVMFNVLGCVPDGEFLQKVNEAALECINRHPELYGLKKDIGKEEDDAILQEERELEEAKEEIRKDIEENPVEEVKPKKPRKKKTE